MGFPESCDLCPRLCMADRRVNTGFCGGSATCVVAKVMLHPWEEPCICGSGSAGAVFFAGCSLSCVFCQNKDISQTLPLPGERCDAAALAGIFQKLEKDGAVCLDLVTPSHFAPVVNDALLRYRPQIPVVYNIGGYERAETVKRYMGGADIFLTDFKYGSRETGERYSRAPDYPDVAEAALVEMHRITGSPEYGADGRLKRGIVVRHLVLPGERRDSVRALERIAATVPPGDVVLSLMRQYTPGWAPPEMKNLSRRVTSFEYGYVLDAAVEMGFEGYSQEGDSASAAYTPKWDE